MKLEKVISLTPSKEQLSKLLQLFQNKKYNDVEKLALTLTKKFPKHQFAWKILGITFQVTGRIEESLSTMQKLVDLEPNNSEIHNNLGISFHKIGRLDDAEKSFKQAIKFKPNLIEAYNNLGVTLQELGKLEEAEKNYKHAILLQPDNAKSYKNLGFTLRKLGRLEEAVKSYQQAIKFNPDLFTAHDELGLIFQEIGKLDEAEKSFIQAIRLNPIYAKAHNNLGITLQEFGRLEAAEESIKKAIKLKPDSSEPYNNLGVIYQEIGKLDEAEKNYKHSIDLNPNSAETFSNLGVNFQELGKFEEAKKSYKQAIKLKPNYTKAISNLLFLYSGFDYNPSTYLQEAKKYNEIIEKLVKFKFSSWLCKEKPEKLRVGFISGDLRNHPVGYFLENFLSKITKSNLELYAYPTQFKSDDLSLRIKPFFSAWKPLIGLSNEAAAKLIHSDAIHILIDLSGHTSNNRLPIFSWKPAPIQISWLGYFASTGVSEIDYILGDPYATPHEDKAHFIEKIWQLPETFLCFTEPNIKLDVGPLPALSNDYITFGCFSKIARITDNVISTWSKILLGIPSSKLFLKDSSLSKDSIKEIIYKKFSLVGINKERLILEGKSPRDQYLKTYNRVDIALSPFPYGSVTTSAEGLWMGVPIVVMKGSHFNSRLGESIINNASLSEWIASNEDDYVFKATKFNNKLDDLAKLRSSLREQVVSSPLFNSERFCNNFEVALRDIWNIKVSNKKNKEGN